MIDAHKINDLLDIKCLDVSGVTFTDTDIFFSREFSALRLASLFSLVSFRLRLVTFFSFKAAFPDRPYCSAPTFAPSALQPSSTPSAETADPDRDVI